MENAKKREGNMAISAAQREAVKRYQEKKYDRVSVLLPAGTKELITATGESVNGYIVDAVLDALNTRASKPEDLGASAREKTYHARASNSVNVPCDVWEKLKGYGDPEKIILTAAKNALKLYDIVM